MIQMIFGTLAIGQLVSSIGLLGYLDNQWIARCISTALTIGEWLLFVFTGSLFIVSMLLLGECLAAWLPNQHLIAAASASPPRAVVLIPAHNEEAVITETLMGVQHQLRQDAYLSQTELWVIADNCDDATAELARQAGAKVLERHHAVDRGKGYALDFGLQKIAAVGEQPEAVVVIDADCQVHPGAIATLIKAAILHQRPIQGNYYMTLPDKSPMGSELTDRITAFAARVKNEVRSAGLSQLGLPCLLVGSGMAFPWACLESVHLASGELVEDMKLGFDLAIAQQSPMFCREAVVTASLPQNESAARSQRTRWEHGRMDLTRRYWPKLIASGLRQGRFGLIALALDMAILPLSLLAIMWLMLTFITAAFASLGSIAPLLVCMASGACIALAILLAWLQVGRDTLPLRQLLLVPVFIFWKLPIFVRFVFSPQNSWIRTERDAA